MTGVSQPGGTAYSIFYDFPPEIKVAAKTGTSQPGQASYKSGKKEYYDGIFIAYAPADDPQVAFAAVVEYGYSGNGSGGVSAAKYLKSISVWNRRGKMADYGELLQAGINAKNNENIPRRSIISPKL